MKIGDKVKYLGSTATVVERFWDDACSEWRCIVLIRQGKHAGYWGVKEKNLGIAID